MPLQQEHAPEINLPTSSEDDIKREKEFAQLAKALSHPARLRIIKILLQLDGKGRCFNADIVEKIGLAQSTVSEHLRVLKNADLIHAKSNPPKMCYLINKEKLKEFCILLTEDYL